VCLSKGVKVTDNRKDTRLLWNLSFSVIYASVMFCSKGLRWYVIRNRQRPSFFFNDNSWTFSFLHLSLEINQKKVFVFKNFPERIFTFGNLANYGSTYSSLHPLQTTGYYNWSSWSFTSSPTPLIPSYHGLTKRPGHNLASTHFIWTSL
jgi:hypothetical protein